MAVKFKKKVVDHTLSELVEAALKQGFVPMIQFVDAKVLAEHLVNNPIVVKPKKRKKG